MQEHAERRKARRYTTQLKVYEITTGKLLGLANNISITGLMLKSDDPVPENQEIHVILNNDEGNGDIALTLLRIWSSFSDTEPKYYYSGLSYVDITDTALDAIQKLIDRLNK